MQQHQPISHPQHFVRHNSRSNSVILTSPPFPNQQNNQLFQPAPQHFPVRPSSGTTQHRPPLAHSFIARPYPNFPPNDRDLQLDSVARKFSQQGQRKECELTEVHKDNFSREKNVDYNKSFFNSYAGSGNGRYPLAKSTLLSGTTGSSCLPQEKEKIIPSNNHLQVPSSFDQNGNGYDLKLELTEKRGSSIRQSKTDRETPQRSPLVLGYSNTPQAKVLIGSSSKYQFITKDVSKPNSPELDSTVNSSMQLKKEATAQKPSTKEGEYIIKKNSPINFWPLSISPCEEKRESSLMDQVYKVELEKTQATQDTTCNEFKKKKNFEFLRNLKKKASIASVKSQSTKSFQITDFQLMDKIGKGAFGDVYIARQQHTGFLCVIKKLQKKKLKELKLEEQLLRQIKIQSFLEHRHLTNLYGFFSDQTCIYLILELMPDGSLMQVKKKRKIPEPQVSFYVRQICLGLKHMHNENIIHRDIKPENIFLNDNYAKIGDFGCSVFTSTNRNTQIGSFAYISPEQLKLESYNEKIDVWSVGVMTYEMLVGASPFEADIIEISKKSKAPELSRLTFPENCELTHDAKSFLEGLLDLDPKQRLGIDEALRHQFIQKYLKRQDEGGRPSF